MAAKGADANTREEMAQTLFGVDGGKLDGAIEALVALNAEILEANKDQVTLTTANGLWTNQHLFDLNARFAASLKSQFGAEISAEDFSDPAVAEKINAWAADNTNNLITKIVDQLTPSDYAILASALYFKGDWTHKFDKEKTKDLSFTTDDGTQAKTPVMHQFYEDGDVKYQKGEDYEAVALTYGALDGDNDKYPTMRIVLVRPNDASVSARDWLTKQADVNEPAWMQRFGYNGYRAAEGTVELPRIDIKQTFDLIPALKDLGIRDAFNNGANFSRMADGSINIGSVTHDTVFKTNEEGSEAAAVTSIGFECTSVPQPPQKIDVKFDRSFVFALQDLRTGAVIFTGAVNKPNNEMTPVKARDWCGTKVPKQSL